MEFRNWICILSAQVDLMDEVIQKIRQFSIRLYLRVENQITELNRTFERLYIFKKFPLKHTREKCLFVL